jgi:uncharacterized lipoprotein YddW (UPF0748 family)
VKLISLFALTLATWGTAFTFAQSGGAPMVALYHRPTLDAAARAALWETCERAGVTDLFVHTFYHGFTVYPSSEEITFAQRPEFVGRDVLREYIDEGHARGLRIHAWVDLLLWGPDYDEHSEIPRNAFADSHPEWRAVDADGHTPRQFFVAPVHREVKNRVTLLCLQIGHLHRDLDGIHLDQVRYPGGDDFGFDATAVSEFMSLGHRDPRESPDEAAEAWREFRRGRLTELVNQIGLVLRRGVDGLDVVVSAAAFPDAEGGWSTTDLKSQDWPTWLANESLDFVVLRCFESDVERMANTARLGVEAAGEDEEGIVIGLARFSGEESPSPEESLGALDALPIAGTAWLSLKPPQDDADEWNAVSTWAASRAASSEFALYYSGNKILAYPRSPCRLGG